MGSSINSIGHLFIKHWQISKDSYLKFQLEFFKAYLSPNFLKYYFRYKLTNTKYGFMSFYKIHVDSITNEITLIHLENELQKNKILYYEKIKEVFYKRGIEKTDSLKRINKQQIYMLKEIKRILNKHKTNYKIVLSPLYEQIKFNKQDYTILKTIFGTKLYDFAGKNKYTEKITNYYEYSHYRPLVGDSIMNEIY